MEGTKTPYVVIENRKEAIGWAIDNARPGDVIILAGKGHETYQIIGTEKRHFDEREVIRAFLNS
jgi:UDP-N-acetylmuramoyl-L-alanyl-D-glutamate--2,6-diaminopimelate ligase